MGLSAVYIDDHAIDVLLRGLRNGAITSSVIDR